MSLLTAIVGAATALSWVGAQPQLATTDDRVYLTFADDRSISVARSDDLGSTFLTPSKITFEGELALGMRRGPRIVATPRAVVVAAILGRKGGGADGDVVVYRSTDRGTRWSAPLIINDVPGSAREGLHAIAASPRGVLAVVWLDLRDTGTKIYAAISRDHGASWSADRLVYASPSGTVCECCHPSVAIDDKGNIAVLFRNSIDGNRDMYLVRSKAGDRFGSAAKLGTGAWKLDGCPMDGGDLELGPDGPSAVWRREKDLFLSTAARAEDCLASGRQPVIGRSGTLYDLAWTDRDEVSLLRKGRAAEKLGKGQFPSIVSLPHRTVLAWENAGKVELRAVGR